MKFSLKKLKLSFGVTTLIMGAGLSATAASLLTVGTHAKTFYEVESLNGKYKSKISVGLGNQNFGDVSVSYYDSANNSVSQQTLKDNKAEDLIQNTDEFVTSLKGTIGDTKYSDAISKLNDAIDSIENPDKNSDLKEAQEKLATAQQAMQVAYKNLQDAPSEATKQAYDTAKGNVNGAQWVIDDIYSSTSQYKDAKAKMISGYDMMLSGAVLLPIFAIVLALGIAATTIAAINKKKNTISE